MNPALQRFCENLSRESRASRVTVKNYASDINKFIRWFESAYAKQFEPQELTSAVISAFRNPDFSPRSLERYISSLRKFALFLQSEGTINENPFAGSEATSKTDAWSLKGFRNYLYVKGASKHTSKNYIVDVASFTSWLEDSQETISLEAVNRYKSNLLARHLAASSINRKFSSIRKYLRFLSESNIPQPLQAVPPVDPIVNGIKQMGSDAAERVATRLAKLDLEEFSHIDEPKAVYSAFPPLRLAQRLASPYLALENWIANYVAFRIYNRKLIQKATLPNTNAWHKRLVHHARNTRPEWYKKYHSITFTHYIHLAVLVIYASIIGFVLYESLFSDPSTRNVLAAPISPPRILSFQGRLTDENNSPVTSQTNVRFLVYNSDTSSGSALLWQDVKIITPDNNGVFYTMLGAAPNLIPASLFREHDMLYLGISVGSTSELSPRQRIATVAYAANAESLQGLIPTTDSAAPTTNAVLALDSSGVLTIGGSASPVFQATGGQFKISGQPLLLTTNTGSNGDVQLVPDGLGRIDLQGALTNQGIRGEIAPGGVEINDRAGVFATESAVAAFIVSNDTTGGDILAASSSGTTRFVLSNNGDVSLQPGVSIDTLSTGTITLGSGNATTISLGRSGQGIAFPAFTGQNGILYGTFGTGVLGQATTSTTGLCLLSGASNPSWSTCTGSGANFAISSGTIRPINSTLDLLIGGTSTSSADFAVLNVNGSGPVTATLSGNLIVMPRDGVGGNVGIGTDTPGVSLHINSTADTDILRLQDADGTCNHNPEAGTETVSCSSDESLKENIRDAAEVLPGLLSIQIRDYNIKATGDMMTGVIAQEVREIAPDMVSEGENELLNVKLPSPWILLKAIQEVASQTSKAVEHAALLSSQLSQLTSEILDLRSNLTSPVASIDEIKTKIVSPLGSDKVTVKGSLAVSGSLTADSLQTTGDASIAGTLTANAVDSSQLTVDIATVSGTLYANKIEANSIIGLDAKIASVSAGNISIYHQQLATASSTLLASIEDDNSLIQTDLIDVTTLSADFGNFRDGLISLGPSTFSQATFIEGVSIGTSLTIGENSINTLGPELEIQPLKTAAISLMAGAVRIETDGSVSFSQNATFAKDVKVEGKLSTNILSPLPGRELVLHGNVVASGSATFGKLNLTLAEDAYALSETEVEATGSAGLAAIKPFRNELTVYTPHVTEKSLIYITPVGSTDQVLYLLRQVAGESFTVGVNTPAAQEIQFNWIIVN